MRYVEQPKEDPNILVGIGHSDDASVYKLTEEIAMIQSVDFFTPVVDDPYMFGQIAAANSLSDIYAMGGEPKTALNIVAYPMQTLGPEILGRILQGANDKAKEAGIEIVGGHSVEDNEPKFGLSVTGIVHPEKFYKNIGAKPKDVLVLTKPLGIGVLTTALKRDLLEKEDIERISKVMATLNKIPAETLRDFHPNAVTDVTGFGLLGHAYEMASGSHVTFEIHYSDVPFLPKAMELAKDNVFPGGSWANHRWLDSKVEYDKSLESFEQALLCDAITSGGLLISLPEEEADAYIAKLKERTDIEARIIGRVVEEKDKPIYVYK